MKNENEILISNFYTSLFICDLANKRKLAKDLFGKKLNIGDKVLYMIRDRFTLKIGSVIYMDNNYCIVSYKGNDSNDHMIKRLHGQVIKIFGKV